MTDKMIIDMLFSSNKNCCCQTISYGGPTDMTRQKHDTKCYFLLLKHAVVLIVDIFVLMDMEFGR